MKEYKYENTLPARNRLVRACWSLAYLLLFRPTPRWALNGWRASLLRIFGARIGRGSRIHPSVRIWAPWNLEIGDYVAVAEGVELYSVAKIKIGSKCAVSQRSFICTASHDITSLKRPLTHAPIEVGDHVWIAAESMVHPGVTVSDGVIVAARSVLRDSPEAWTVWAGNPARCVGARKLANELNTEILATGSPHAQ